MTRKELEHVRKVLEAIKNPDGHVKTAIAYCNKDIALREAQRDNFRPEYELEEGRW